MQDIHKNVLIHYESFGKIHMQLLISTKKTFVKNSPESKKLLQNVEKVTDTRMHFCMLVRVAHLGFGRDDAWQGRSHGVDVLPGKR